MALPNERSPASDPASGPTVAQLKADIDSGRTGDKVQVSDPGLSPLGTDDEAGGAPNSPKQVALARAYETRDKGGGNPAMNPRSGWAGPAFIGFIAVVAVAFASLLWLR